MDNRLKTIDRNIRTLSANPDKIDNLVQTTADLIVVHANEHGDTTRALALVTAMPTGKRKTQLVDWFNVTTPITVDTKKKTVCLQRDKVLVEAPEGENANAFRNMPAVQKAPANKMQLADAQKLAGKLVTKLEKALADKNVAKRDIDAFGDLVLAIRNAANIEDEAAPEEGLRPIIIKVKARHDEAIAA